LGVQMEACISPRMWEFILRRKEVSWRERGTIFDPADRRAYLNEEKGGIPKLLPEERTMVLSSLDSFGGKSLKTATRRKKPKPENLLAILSKGNAPFKRTHVLRVSPTTIVYSRRAKSDKGGRPFKSCGRGRHFEREGNSSARRLRWGLADADISEKKKR